MPVDEAEQTSYVSLDEATCMAEVSHHLGATVKLRHMIAFEFELDLAQQLTGDDHSIPQDIARHLRRDKVQALIVPSARDPHGKNVVLFLENINKKATRKIREQKLNRNASRRNSLHQIHPESLRPHTGADVPHPRHRLGDHLPLGARHLRTLPRGRGKTAPHTPNPAMANFPPTDLLQSGYAFRKLIELVEQTKHGDFS